MQKRGLWSGLYFALAAVLVTVVLGTGAAYAQTSTSNNYQITETQFNAGSNLESCSTGYCARATIGGDENTVPSGSAMFTSTHDDDEPVLEVIIEPGESNLGTLSPETTATKTTTVRIRSFLSGGYLLQVVGNSPVYAGHHLATPTTPTASQPGTEQFGINVVKNTIPDVGEDPDQVPENEEDTTIFGTPQANYGTPNLFMYESGATIANSVTQSGRTDYTISMIVNISNSTPAGHYSGDFAAVVMPAF